MWKDKVFELERCMTKYVGEMISEKKKSDGLKMENLGVGLLDREMSFLSSDSRLSLLKLMDFTLLCF